MENNMWLIVLGQAALCFFSAAVSWPAECPGLDAAAFSFAAVGVISAAVATQLKLTATEPARR
ncbi:MAG TPA: hypothetical protein VHG92_07345 [Afifellaceae bacterium]|nr:hypothetical protein [Afifellaceae bacterium]